MKVCFICVEVFAWGKYGGFGRATRIIGRELAKKGIEVFAVVPRRKGQKSIEELDGITVLSFPSYLPWSSRDLYRECNADIYHSQEPSFGTYFAMKSMPSRKHIVTFRDPRDTNDWKIEFRLPSLSKLQVLSNYLYENNFFIKRAIQRSDGMFCAAKSLIPKVRLKYSLKSDPNFLPTPIAVPDKVQKAINPTVCFLARWDRRKRPQLFFELAKKFPYVKFIAIGKAQDRKWDSYLRKTYSNLSNLEITGFIDQFSSSQLSHILGKSWVLVNTSAREGLPNSFIEATAHRCAILSSIDPDGFASQFGYHAKDDDFVDGLEFLLENQRWKERGERGYEYVKETFEMGRAIEKHIAIYQEVLNKNSLSEKPKLD
jgi:glycosyltransferase involved in cell wall biosynthesis